MKRAQGLARHGILVAFAMILSYVEAQIPAFWAVPGMKLGLTNIVVLLALYQMGTKSALVINGIRIFLVAVLFGNGMSLAYSAAGGLLSGLIMIILKKTGRFRMITVSIAGGIFHNIGQILVAMALLQTKALAWYLVFLWCAGLASGFLIGILGEALSKGIRLDEM